MNEALLVENPVLLQANSYEKLAKTRLTNLIKKSKNGGKTNFRLGQFVFLSNDNIKTVKGSRQLINPICRDLYKIISTEKQGFSYRIHNTRNLAERTVVHSELRCINLEDVLYMEIHPQTFIQSTGKAIRNSAFKRGNLTALKLIEMSQGNLNTPDTSQVIDTHDTAKEQKESSE